jgi:hypothetical protein
MKYVYNIKHSANLTPDQFRCVLPSHFLLREENEQLMVIIEREGEPDEKQVFYEIERECDRIFFLTGIQLDPTLIRVERPDGLKMAHSAIKSDCILYEQLPSDLDRQQWTQILEIQLRLWQLANLPNIPLSVQIMLLFQIIECFYPDTNDSKSYPVYDPNDFSQPPHHRTEAKLIRDWVSHQKKKVDRRQLQNYCKYMGLKEKKFFNPTDAIHQQIIPKLYQKVKNEAEKIIASSITLKTLNYSVP